jgi:DNA helicase-2/ATP-dependent DNA helicase PcrA
LVHLHLNGFGYNDPRLPVQYDHLVLDEAQEFTGLELSLLNYFRKENCTLTVAGDAAQQIDPATHFNSWEDHLQTLGCRQKSMVELQTIYRSPQPIADLAYEVLGPLAPPHKPQTPKSGLPLLFSEFPNQVVFFTCLINALNELVQKNPQAYTALICRDQSQAAEIYHHLKGWLPVNLITAGEFNFEKGIEITPVYQVKGLEFDYVILADVDPDNYRDNLLDRRILYVALTRALEQIWLTWQTTPSPLLPKSAQPNWP